MKSPPMLVLNFSPLIGVTERYALQNIRKFLLYTSCSLMAWIRL